MIDLTAELRAALTDPQVAVILTAYLKEALRQALAEHAHDSWLTHRQAAQVLGLSVTAFVAQRRRHPELDRISAGEGRLRRWRRADLESWLRRQKQSR
ncbi:MAG TPA: helix-turn-helix domain-containing protein [Pseudomonadota bacterium]|nr:helix-turn-helix domain-containing protein [Pseudomonadota bacterium]